MPDPNGEVPRLELEAVIGFNGKVPGGLKVHPKRQHLIYPLGCTVVIEEISSTKKQEFLSGHSNDVTCLAVSKSGRYIASGQVTYMGFKADIIVWDFESRSLYAQFTLHKVKVESLAFSTNELYLFSLGGQDDGNVVVWDIPRKEAICGSPAQVESAGTSLCIVPFNSSDDYFVTAGEYTLRLWCLDRPNRKILATEVHMGKLKRVIKSLEISEDDSVCYCGTTSGDILAINTNTKLLTELGPGKEKFTMGVTAMALLKTGDLIVATGSGEVCMVKGVQGKFKRIKDKSRKVDGAVSSIALRGQGHQFYVGDSTSHQYRFNFAEFSHELINSCHYSSIADVVFPFGTSDLFASCSYQDIRVWHLPTSKELLRITVPNMRCNALDFMRDGKSVLSGWDDGKIRAFYPETGRAMYVINDAHQKGVTALATTADCQRIISGGGEGQVRVWEVNACQTAKGITFTTKLIQALKEHKGSVSCIKVRKNDAECVSASTDGTCIIWDLRFSLASGHITNTAYVQGIVIVNKNCRPYLCIEGGNKVYNELQGPQYNSCRRFVRNQVLFANTLFKCVSYRPDECQVVTSGTDRKIGYWEVFDGALIRELEGSKSGSINGLDIDGDGIRIVTGGDDRLVKVWLYNEGEVTHVGLGHSGAINRIRICPNSQHIISVSSDGAILRWKLPQASSGLLDGSGDANAVTLCTSPVHVKTPEMVSPTEPKVITPEETRLHNAGSQSRASVDECAVKETAGGNQDVDMPPTKHD